MHLNTAIVPPRHVLEEVAVTVRQACDQAQTVVDGPGEGQLRSLLRRARRPGRGADAAGSPTVPPQLDLVPLDALSLFVAGFGYVTAGDSLRLTTALELAAAGIARPTVHFAGGAALEFEGDQQVWVRVAGDVDALREAARAVTTVVEPLGFFVDRRKFRPLLAVGTITETTTAPYLQVVMDALDAFSGTPWELDYVRLMRLSSGARPRPLEMDRFPLQP